jgi:Predicted transmembrane sensor domain
MAALVDDRLELGLALVTLMTALGEETVFLQTGPYGLESLRLGDLTVPVNPDGSFNVFFKGGRRKFDYISAGDVLAGRVEPGRLAGRLAFVGTSAPGLMDVRVTPFERVYPGVEVHADVLDAIITGHYLRRPPWTPAAQAGLIVLTGLLAGTAFGLARPWLYLLVGSFCRPPRSEARFIF